MKLQNSNPFPWVQFGNLSGYKSDNLKKHTLIDVSGYKILTPAFKEFGEVSEDIIGGKTSYCAKDYTMTYQATIGENHNIHGNGLFLAACRPHVAMTVYNKIVTAGNVFVNAQINRKTFDEQERQLSTLLKSNYFLENPKTKRHVINVFGNVFDFSKTTKLKFSQIELDLMTNLEKDVSNQCVQGLLNCAADRCLFSIWHSSPRNKEGLSEKYHNITAKRRIYLGKNLKKHFEVLEYNALSYYDIPPNSNRGYPMRVDIYVLKRI